MEKEGKFVIKESRLAAGFTQKEIAERIGVDRTSVAKWETGKSYPRGETLVKLASVMGCSIDELFGRGQSSS